MSTERKSRVVTEELFTVTPPKPLDPSVIRQNACGAIDRVALVGRRGVVTDAERLAALESLALLAWQVNWCQDVLVGKLRDEGTTWREIGEALGVTRSAAQQRFSS